MHGARFRVFRAIYQAFEPGVHHGAGAHGTWFNCSKQLAVSQAVVTDGGTGFAEGYDLGVGGGIGISNIAIPAPPHNAVAANHDRACRNLSGLQCALGGAERFFHPEFVGRTRQWSVLIRSCKTFSGPLLRFRR